MPQHILKLLQQAKEDLEFEEKVLTREFWAELLAPLD